MYAHADYVSSSHVLHHKAIRPCDARETLNNCKTTLLTLWQKLQVVLQYRSTWEVSICSCILAFSSPDAIAAVGVGRSGSLPSRAQVAMSVDFLRAGPTAAAACVDSAIGLGSLWRFSLDRCLSSYRRKESLGIRSTAKEKSDDQVNVKIKRKCVHIAHAHYWPRGIPEPRVY